jgi:hypothetical protein
LECEGGPTFGFVEEVAGRGFSIAGIESNLSEMSMKK